MSLLQRMQAAGTADTTNMPWAVGQQLGYFCGATGCREKPAAYSQMCLRHNVRSPWVRGALSGSLPAKDLGR